MATTQKTGTFKVVDDDGNTMELYPNILTDTTLSESSKAADGASVGERIAAIEAKLETVLYIVSFDPETETLVTRSADYEEA